MNTFRSQRPASDEYAPYYHTYVTLAPEGDIVDVLATQRDRTLAFLAAIDESDAMMRYAAGKWSIKEVVGHVIDAERIFTYRILRFARNDQTPIEGFDEDQFVMNAAFDTLPLVALAAEFETVRLATLSLLRHLPEETWSRSGVASGYPVSVRALAYILAGHERHHVAIIGERYLEQLPSE